VSLCPATAKDTEAILGVFQTSRRLLHFVPVLHSDDEDRAFIRDHVLARMEVTLAEESTRCVGFLATMPGWIEHLYLTPDAIGQGHGRALLQHAMADQAALQLWCFAANTHAIGFYTHHGFRIIDRTTGANEEGLPDVLMMWRRDGDPSGKQFVT